MPFIGTGPDLTQLNASNLASGTVPTARMPAFVSSVNGQTGAVTVSAGMSVDTNTASSATNYAVGTTQLIGARSSLAQALNSTFTPSRSNTASQQTAILDTAANTGIASTNLSGTWRMRGFFDTGGNALYYNTSNANFFQGRAALIQRTA